MFCCCTRSSKMNTPLLPFCPDNACDWCGSDLSTQIIYLLDTETIEEKDRTSLRIGNTCCLDKGKHAVFCIAFVNRWKVLPMMKFMFEPRAENVTQMFANAKALHFNGADRLDVKAAFRDAWNTYNRLSAADKTLVIH